MKGLAYMLGRARGARPDGAGRGNGADFG